MKSPAATSREWLGGFFALGRDPLLPELPSGHVTSWSAESGGVGAGCDGQLERRDAILAEIFQLAALPWYRQRGAAALQNSLSYTLRATHVAQHAAGVTF